MEAVEGTGKLRGERVQSIDQKASGAGAGLGDGCGPLKLKYWGSGGRLIPPAIAEMDILTMAAGYSHATLHRRYWDERNVAFINLKKEEGFMMDALNKQEYFALLLNPKPITVIETLSGPALPS
jgi:hypothetical protein